MKHTYKEQINLECTCASITTWEWEKLMKNAKKANGFRIRQMIKKQLPELYSELCLQFPNPYEGNSKKTNDHYVYVHSAIEYFLSIN